jgi:hypothetical protein
LETKIVGENWLLVHSAKFTLISKIWVKNNPSKDDQKSSKNIWCFIVIL